MVGCVIGSAGLLGGDGAFSTTPTPGANMVVPQPRKTNVKASASTASPSPATLIDRKIAELGDWRGATLRRMRDLIREADPEVVETWKWMGTPVWEHAGILCTGETYKGKVKLTFAKGASLKDPAGLFNSSLDGNVRRAIDIQEGGEVDAEAFKALVRAAVALNVSGVEAKAKAKAGRAS